MNKDPIQIEERRPIFVNSLDCFTAGMYRFLEQMYSWKN